MALIKSFASRPHGPSVSNSTATKTNRPSNLVYLILFSASISAPAKIDVECTYDAIRVSTQVASQIIHSFTCEAFIAFQNSTIHKCPYGEAQLHPLNWVVTTSIAVDSKSFVDCELQPWPAKKYRPFIITECRNDNSRSSLRSSYTVLRVPMTTVSQQKVSRTGSLGLKMLHPIVGLLHAESRYAILAIMVLVLCYSCIPAISCSDA